MTDVQRSEIKIHRMEYSLNTPTDFGELEKLYGMVKAQVNPATPVHVETRDQQIIVWYETRRGTVDVP